MPYIQEPAILGEIFQSADAIPVSETAKLAMVRPTEHFAIVTADNPDMVRTLQEQDRFVESELSKIATPLSDAEREEHIETFKAAFQKELARRASSEHQGLLHALEAHGIPTAIQVEDKGKMETAEYDFYTDQIFATDTGQYYDNNGKMEFIPSLFRNQQRKGEERLVIEQAKTFGAEVRPLISEKTGEPLIFEGGDIRQMPGRQLFFIGGGHRSDTETSEAIARVSGYYVLPVVLLQEQFYHLDCCFLPLPHDSAVIYEGDHQLDENGDVILDEQGWPCLVPGTETMAPESRALIRTIYPPERLVLITREEASAYATNAAVLFNTTTDRFKMFVNGCRDEAIDIEQDAIAKHTISYTDEHMQQIQALTHGQMDIVEVPYVTMHASGGSVRCTIQEVACTTQALTAHLEAPLHFSQRLLDTVESPTKPTQQGSRYRHFQPTPDLDLSDEIEEQRFIASRNSWCA